MPNEDIAILQCAEIVVNQIIDALTDEDIYISGENNLYELVSYWKEVKKELLKL